MLTREQKSHERLFTAIFQFVLGISTLQFLLLPSDVSAERREYDLTIAQGVINFADAEQLAMMINGRIPGPVLRFTEGDRAVIKVHNKMDVETSIHWHGLLLPNNMDGVPNLTYPPIAAGTTFTYEFDIRHSGTYWYHSHTSLQEQRGLYGSIVITPKKKGKFDNIREHVVVLSDWTDEEPHTVLHTLKRGSEWYAVKKKTAQSIFGAASVGRLGDYFKRELQRMPPMDLSDVYYDAFLVNGKKEESLDAQPGEKIRLRVINGSATSYFYIEHSGGEMKILSADGQDVQPVAERRLLIGVAETYDVLVNVPHSGKFEFRATAHDGSGYASLWVGNGNKIFAPDIPYPNLYVGMGGLSFSKVFALTPAASMGMTTSNVKRGKFDKPGMNGMRHESMEMGNKTSDDHMMHLADDKSAHGKIGHSKHEGTKDAMAKRGDLFGLLSEDLSSQKMLAVDGMDSERPWPPYDKLRSPQKTAFDATRPIREIRLTLDGDMKRYVWFLNGKPLSESDSIAIKQGEVIRFIMINRTMMHHPMHLHGHFFRVINNHGDYSPLKHTVNVAPMSTTVIEFDANEFGDWFFHCHLLYHMKSGMARVVHYENFKMDPALAAVRPNLYQDNYYLFGRADAMSNMAQGFVTTANSRHIFSAEWQAGWQGVDETEWEVAPTYDYYLNRFTTVFAGVDLEGGRSIEKDVGVFGFRHLLPLNIESRSWVDTDGEFQFSFGKSLELTPRLMIYGEFEYDTEDRWEIRSGLNYVLSRDFSIVSQWHNEFEWGGGVQLRF